MSNFEKICYRKGNKNFRSKRTKIYGKIETMVQECDRKSQDLAKTQNRTGKKVTPRVLLCKLNS